MAETINTFRSGMKADLAEHLRDKDSYSYLMCGRISWNELDGDGKTGDLMPIRGTAPSFELTPGYTWIGSAKLGGSEAVIVSASATNSEIGIATYDKASDSVSYRPIYSDKHDPNSGKLGFAANRRIRVDVAGDSPARSLVYLLDPMQSPIYTINLFHAKNNLGVYLHRNVAPTAQNTYPRYWSVHHFRLQPDAIHADVNLYGQYAVTTGGLSSGVYRYSYRYISEKKDVVSSWSPLSLPVFVSAERESSTTANHHERVMGPSGKGAKKKNIILLGSPDYRWWGVEFGYTKTESENAYSVFTVVGRYPLLSVFAGIDPTIEHVSEAGLYTLPIEALSGLQAVIETAADIRVHDNRLFVGAPVLTPNARADLTKVSISPINRQLTGDITFEPVYTTKSDPITNSFKVNAGLLELGRYAGKKKELRIYQDYYNYKSPLIHAELAGYRRESVTPVGVTLFDRAGQPMPVQPIGSFTAPKIEDNPLTVQPGPGRVYNLNVLGFSVSGVRIRRSDVLDSAGNIKLSGFSIVRGEPATNVLHQGVLFPTVRFVASAQTGRDPKRPDFTFPHGGPTNTYRREFDRINASHFYTGNLSWFYKKDNGEYTGIFDYTFSRGDEIGSELYTRPSNHNYYSADTFIEADSELKFVFDKKSDSVQLVGTACRSYASDAVAISLPPGYRGVNLAHVYNKLYKVNGLVNPGPGRPKMGDSVSLRAALLQNISNKRYEKYDPNDERLSYESHQHVQVRINQSPPVVQYVDALHTTNGLLLSTDGFESVDVTDGAVQACYHLVNYLRTGRVGIDDNSQAQQTNTPFQYCGHYQPLTRQILATVPTGVGEDDEVYYVFDGIDVFGGDTFVNFVDFTRLMPFWSEGCDDRESDGAGLRISYMPDYSVSHIVPMESKYNTALRYGRSFAKDCVRPQFDSCKTNRKDMDNGVMRQQPETWAYNRALLHRENVVRYFPSGPDEVYSQERPYSIYYSNQTIYGETQDSKRTVLARNKREIEGAYGAITNLGLTMDSLYVFQPRALALLPTKNREVLSSTAGGSLYFGDGQVIEKERYINTENGCQRYCGLGNLGMAMYWIDERTRHFCRFSQDGLSKIDEERQLRVQTGINIDKLTDYFIMAHQNQNEVLINLRGSEWPGFVFHETQNVITTIMPVSFTMGEMINKAQIVQQVEQPGKPGRLGKGNWNSFSGRVYRTVLRFTVTTNDDLEHEFNNVLVAMAGDEKALKQIVAKAESAEHVIDVQNNRLARYWSERWQLPLVQGEARLPRLRGPNLFYTFSFELTDNQPFILRQVRTVFNITGHN